MVERDRVKEAIAVLQQLAEVQALERRSRPGKRSSIQENAIRMEKRSGEKREKTKSSISGFPESGDGDGD